MAFRTTEERKVVACLFLILFMGVADNQILSPLLSDIRNQFAKSSSEMGLLFSGYSFCAGLSVLVWGPLSDIFGRKKGLLTGLILFSAGSMVSFLASSFLMLLYGRIITGMGASMLSLNSISYAADFFPYKNRGWAMGSIFASYFAALILGVPLGSWLGGQFGWNKVFGVMGIVALVLFGCTQILLPQQALDTARIRMMRQPIESVRQYAGFLRIPSNLAALLSSLFASGGTTGFIAFLGIWLHDAFGVPGSKTGLVFLASGAAALLASPFAGSLSDRIGKRFQFVVSCAFLAMMLFILPALHWGWILFGSFGLISLGAAFRQGPMEAMLSEMASAESRGAFVALKNSFSQLGIGLAALLSGILFESHGYWAVCILCAFANVLAAFCMLFTLRARNL